MTIHGHIWQFPPRGEPFGQDRGPSVPLGAGDSVPQNP